MKWSPASSTDILHSSGLSEKRTGTGPPDPVAVKDRAFDSLLPEQDHGDVVGPKEGLGGD